MSSPTKEEQVGAKPEEEVEETPDVDNDKDISSDKPENASNKEATLSQDAELSLRSAASDGSGTSAGGDGRPSVVRQSTVPARPTHVESKGVDWKPIPSKKNKYVIDILSEQDIEGAAHCFASIFTERELLAKAVNATYEETLPFAKALAKCAADAQLSTVARLRETGEVVGFCISEDYVKAELEPAAEHCPESLVPVFVMLENVHHAYRKKHMKEYGRPPIGGEIQHVLAVGVLKKHSGKNLSKKITVSNQKLAWMKGFKLTAGEATGHASQHLVKKYSAVAFKTVIHIPYDDFDYKGTNPFKNLDPPSCLFATAVIKKHGRVQPNAALWVPDNDSGECMQCERKFTVTRRRHHCRHCGNLVCADCSLSRVVLPGFDYKKVQRVCDQCVSRAFLADREDIQADEEGVVVV